MPPIFSSRHTRTFHNDTSAISGFTITELLIIIVLIGILLGVVFAYIPDSRLRARDKERQSDIDILHGRLEEYYQDKGGYPATLNASILPRLDPEALVDPSGHQINILAPVENEAAARAVPNPTTTGTQYIYAAYPTGCTANCIGFILKTVIEKPTPEIPNPYMQGGLNNS